MDQINPNKSAEFRVPVSVTYRWIYSFLQPEKACLNITLEEHENTIAVGLSPGPISPDRIPWRYL